MRQDLRRYVCRRKIFDLPQNFNGGTRTRVVLVRGLSQVVQDDVVSVGIAEQLCYPLHQFPLVASVLFNLGQTWFGKSHAELHIVRPAFLRFHDYDKAVRCCLSAAILAHLQFILCVSLQIYSKFTLQTYQLVLSGTLVMPLGNSVKFLVFAVELEPVGGLKRRPVHQQQTQFHVSGAAILIVVECVLKILHCRRLIFF
jgi:hypothetical protein